MNTLLLAVLPAGGLLTTFLYAVLAIVFIGGLVWCINTYIAPIPPPILTILAVVLVIGLVLWLLGEAPSFR